MKINLDTAPDDAQIQIIPLIDVIFCILTFFILAALQLTRQQGMNVDLPKASTGVVQMRQMLVVSIDAAGQTYIDKNPINRADLFDLLKKYRQENPDGLLVLNASQNAFYNDVIQVLDVLRAVGGDKVALATIPAPAISPSPNGGSIPGFQNPAIQPNGTPGLPNVPGVTDPLLSPSNNPLSPNAPLSPSNFPGIFPGSSGTTTVPPNSNNAPGSNIPSNTAPGSNLGQPGSGQLGSEQTNPTQQNTPPATAP
jgi:biopolymer transport protein ExbD